MDKKAALDCLLDEAIKNIPDDPELIYAEVLLLDPYTDRDKLDKTFKQLLAIEPNSPTYLNAYAYTLALQNRRLKEARKYAELALNMHQNRPLFWIHWAILPFYKMILIPQSSGAATSLQHQPENVNIEFAMPRRCICRVHSPNLAMCYSN